MAAGIEKLTKDPTNRLTLIATVVILIATIAVPLIQESFESARETKVDIREAIEHADEQARLWVLEKELRIEHEDNIAMERKIASALKHR